VGWNLLTRVERVPSLGLAELLVRLIGSEQYPRHREVLHSGRERLINLHDRDPLVFLRLVLSF
jgi:hypothetical protein